MKKVWAIFPFILLFSGMKAQDITGAWNGTLDIQGAQLAIVFHIKKTDDGYKTLMDSPDQGAKGIPTDQTSWEDNTLTITASALSMKYTGKLNTEKETIEGTFEQRGYSLPLVLKKTAEEKKAEPRPQDPKDFPYQQEEVEFFNQKDDVKLAGTLTLPRDKKVDKVVILISGSGPQDRNEEVGDMNHRPFLVLSDYLTRQGIGVLRYDDRGVGQSTGDRSTSTIDDFAEDAEAGVAFLKNRKDLKSAQIGLIGHSEGGMVAPQVAARNKDVDFIVMLAGPGIPIDELMLLQSKLVSESRGAPRELSEINRMVLKDAYTYLRKNPHKSQEALKEGLIGVFKEGMKKFPKEAQDEIKKDPDFFKKEATALLNPWFLNFIRTNPEDYLKKVKVPVLAMNGTLDLQVPAEENLAGIEAALKKAGNKKVEIVALEGLNHLFQKAETGAVEEYAEIEETFNEKAMKKIAGWIKKQ